MVMSLVHGVGVNDIAYPVTYAKGDKRVEHHWYSEWRCMIRRCYGIDAKPSYSGVVVCQDWLSLSLFKVWYDKELCDYLFDKSLLQLDKDLLDKSAKLYSPETCCFLPKSLNKALVGLSCSELVRKRGVKYEAYIKRFGKYKHLGTFSNKGYAQDLAIKEKIKYIKEIIIKEEGITPLPTRLKLKEITYEQ